MSHHLWTKQEDEHLKRLVDEGFTASKIQKKEEMFQNLPIGSIQSRIGKFRREKKGDIYEKKSCFKR